VTIAFDLGCGQLCTLMSELNDDDDGAVVLNCSFPDRRCQYRNSERVDRAVTISQMKNAVRSRSV